MDDLSILGMHDRGKRRPFDHAAQPRFALLQSGRPVLDQECRVLKRLADGFDLRDAWMNRHYGMTRTQCLRRPGKLRNRLRQSSRQENGHPQTD